MKFKIYDEKEKQEEIIYFKLSTTDIRGTEGITLVAVNEEGNVRHNGNILTVSSKGIYLYENIYKYIGLPLDKKGRLKKVK